MKKSVEFKGKIYLYCLIVVSFILLLPLLRISFYNHPSADDYGYSANTYHVYNETHSIPEVIKTAYQDSMKLRYSWQGLYTSSFVQALQPAIFGVKYYAFTAFIILASIWISNFIFSYYVLHVRFKCDLLRTIAVTSVMSMVMTQYMPSAVEGLYWFNGAVNYTLNYGLIVLMLTLCISLTNFNNKTLYVLKIIGISILAFLISGVNYVPAFEGLMLEMIFILFCIVLKDKKATIGGIIGLLFGLFGFYLNISSPGVKVRQNIYEGKAPIEAIFCSMKEGFLLLSNYWGFVTLFFVVLTLPSIIVLAKKTVANTKFKFKYPLLVFFISIMFMCALITPPLYAMGFYDEGRILDMFFITSIFVLYFDVYYFVCYLVSNVLGDYELQCKILEYRLFEKIVGLIIVIVLFVACIANSWAYKATISIASGEAKEYEGEMYQRYSLLMEADDEVILPVIRTKPELLFFNEIAEAPDTWPNTDLERYFGVDKVYLETYFK